MKTRRGNGTSCNGDELYYVQLHSLSDRPAQVHLQDCSKNIHWDGSFYHMILAIDTVHSLKVSIKYEGDP